jgi:hypothetical protein
MHAWIDFGRNHRVENGRIEKSLKVEPEIADNKRDRFQQMNCQSLTVTETG